MTPVLTACGQKITGAALSVKVTQSAFKLAKLPNRTVFTTQTTALMRQLVVASPAGAKIGSVALNAKTTALREAVETVGGIGFDAQSGMITVPSGAFTNLKPGRYTLILDVEPENAVSDAKPIQAKFKGRRNFPPPQSLPPREGLGERIATPVLRHWFAMTCVIQWHLW